MTFYHNLITQKSWQALMELKKKYQFILIGGWAVFLYTKALKSKDIDLVMEYEELEKIKNEFMVSKNERLKKYEAKKQEVEIDIYVPFYSNPGIPAEEIKKFTAQVEGFVVAQKEVLAILKQKAFLERQGSVKGRNDLADLISLFRLPDFYWEKYGDLVRDYRLGNQQAAVVRFIRQTASMEELNLNVYQMARLKKEILPKIEKRNG
jgi:hypothetical protein